MQALPECCRERGRSQTRFGLLARGAAVLQRPLRSKLPKGGEFAPGMRG